MFCLSALLIYLESTLHIDIGMTNFKQESFVSGLIPSGGTSKDTDTHSTFDDILSLNGEPTPPPRWMDDILKPQTMLLGRSSGKRLTTSKTSGRQLNAKNLRLDLSKIPTQESGVPIPRARFGMNSSPSQLSSPATPHRTLTLRSPQVFGSRNGEKKTKKKDSILSLKISTTRPSKSIATQKLNSIGKQFDAKPLRDSLGLNCDPSTESEFFPPRKLLSCSSASSSSSVSSGNSSSSESVAPTVSSSTSPLVPSDGARDDIYDESDFVNSYNAYPEGPVCVLEPNLYLYSEPTVDQINKFDVVINVAQEMKNYSATKSSVSPSEPNSVLKDVDYYFIPWNHNSRLHSDFIKLTKVIDDSLIANKKVLIHCQCGVSRSASLILAYFMRAFHLDYSEAYERLKKHAPSISPNLSLIYELMEWGKYLENQDNFNAQN